MVDIASMEVPKHLEWVLTEEGKRVAMEEIESAAEWIKAGADVFEKYGVAVSVEFEWKGDE